MSGGKPDSKAQPKVLNPIPSEASAFSTAVRTRIPTAEEKWPNTYKYVCNTCVRHTYNYKKAALERIVNEFVKDAIKVFEKTNGRSPKDIVKFLIMSNMQLPRWLDDGSWDFPEDKDISPEPLIEALTADRIISKATIDKLRAQEK